MEANQMVDVDSGMNYGFLLLGLLMSELATSPAPILNLRFPV